MQLLQSFFLLCQLKSQRDHNDDISLGKTAATIEERNQFISEWRSFFFFFFFKHKIRPLSPLSTKCTCWDRKIPFRFPGLSLPSGLVLAEGETHRADEEDGLVSSWFRRWEAGASTSPVASSSRSNLHLAHCFQNMGSFSSLNDKLQVSGVLLREEVLVFKKT